MERSAYIYVNLFSENLGTEYNHVHINSIYVIFANGIFFFFNQSFLIIFFSHRFGKFISPRPHTIMSQASVATCTPSGPPLSQETFDYLWNTLGDCTEGG